YIVKTGQSLLRGRDRIGFAFEVEREIGRSLRICPFDLPAVSRELAAKLRIAGDAGYPETGLPVSEVDVCQREILCPLLRYRDRGGELAVGGDREIYANIDRARRQLDRALPVSN